MGPVAGRGHCRCDLLSLMARPMTLKSTMLATAPQWSQQVGIPALFEPVVKGPWSGPPHRAYRWDTGDFLEISRFDSVNIRRNWCLRNQLQGNDRSGYAG